MKKIIFPFICLVLTCCNQTKFISNGASDNKPLLFEDEYELSDLNELNLEGSAFWGFPKSTELTKAAKHNTGRIISLNGVRISGSNKILPALGMLVYSTAIGTSLSLLFGTKQEARVSYDPWGNQYIDYYYKQRLPLAFGILLAVPLAGALNNITFSQSALGAAGSGLNYKLITDNPKIDIFYYPKYEISNKVNFWTQKAYLKANVKGAKQIIE